MAQKSKPLAALRAAFPHTIPILTGYLFLGMSYGVLMKVSGFSFWYPLLISLTVYAGSMQFVTTSLLLGAFNPIQAFVMTLMVNARHLFYGIALLDRYQDTGWKKPYLIFGLSDETFSVTFSAKIPPEIDKGWFFFWVTALDQLYWVIGATLGGLFGSLISFNTEGLDFVMTAMFVVIFLNQWEKDRQHYSALIGLAAPLVCLAVFGSGSFLLPSMGCILILLLALRKPIEKAESPAEETEEVGA